MPRESQKPSGTPSGAASTAPPVYQPVPARELVQAKMVQHGMRAGAKLFPVVQQKGTATLGKAAPFVSPKRPATPPGTHLAENSIQAQVRSWYGVPMVRPQGGPPQVIQRVAATVYAGFKNLEGLATDADWASGGTSGPEDHAERKAWRAAKDEVKAKVRHPDHTEEELNVQIEVTRGICHHCQVWFELVLLPLLNAWDRTYGRTKATKLYVEVKLKNRKAVVRQVARGMDWSGISYSTPVSTLSKADTKTIRGEVWASPA